MPRRHEGSAGRRPALRLARAIPALVLGLFVLPTVARGQPACAETEPAVEMRMLLEKTIFNVDVLWLTVRIGGPEARVLRDLSSERELTSEAADSVASVAVEATCGRARLDFVRDVSLDRLLQAIRESTRAALDANLITDDTYRFVDESLPEWYAFLEGRGVREGDSMTYRIRGDTLGIEYHSPDGEVLLDRTDVGPERRRSVLAGYFAPDSDFRGGLIESLFRETAETTAVSAYPAVRRPTRGPPPR